MGIIKQTMTINLFVFSWIPSWNIPVWTEFTASNLNFQLYSGVPSRQSHQNRLLSPTRKDHYQCKD